MAGKTDRNPATLDRANSESAADGAALSAKRGQEESRGERDASVAQDSDSSGETSDAEGTDAANPPLPDEPLPPLPSEPPPQNTPDDGWEPVWDPTESAFYFHNRITGLTQWENPRVPDPTTSEAPGAAAAAAAPARPHGGYNPAIHGDYDPTASYAVDAQAAEDQATIAAAAAAATAAAASAAPEPGADYAATGQFNRYTGRWQAADINPSNYGDESKSHRQLSAFYDVDAYNNDGRSLRAERSQMKLTKAQVKAFKEKRRERKEEKRRAWLRD